MHQLLFHALEISSLMLKTESCESVNIDWNVYMVIQFFPNHIGIPLQVVFVIWYGYTCEASALKF